MQSRRHLVIAASALATAGMATRALADQPKIVDYLLVQTAKGLSYDAATSTMSLTGVSPITLFFADRPERIAGIGRGLRFDLRQLSPAGAIEHRHAAQI